MLVLLCGDTHMTHIKTLIYGWKGGVSEKGGKERVEEIGGPGNCKL